MLKRFFLDGDARAYLEVDAGKLLSVFVGMISNTT
jgi:hypothetical protein